MTEKTPEYLPQSLLGCQTNFSFLQGASHPEEIMQMAATLGWQAVGVADLFGVGAQVRAWSASKDIDHENAENRRCAIRAPRLISGTE